jgi:hypothetical protein
MGSKRSGVNGELAPIRAQRAGQRPRNVAVALVLCGELAQAGQHVA